MNKGLQKCVCQKHTHFCIYFISMIFVHKQRIYEIYKKLIEKKYPSHREFSIAYLKAVGVGTSSEEVRKMCNRLSQICNGKKAIQTYDLPVFTDLLEVSCEEILSCGKTFVPVSGHITNYEVAFSGNPEVWEKYAKREDKLILNSDEYNKTVIDYAIEFKNYKFIKFLMDRGYIWFADNSEGTKTDRAFGFGAGTSIERRRSWSVDTALSQELYQDQTLRQKVIALAMENQTFEVLDSLRAREVPPLYWVCRMPKTTRMPSHCHDYYNDDVIVEIVRSNEKTLSYFSEEFSIADQKGCGHSFVYPFLGEVIEKLVNGKSKYAEPVLRRAIKHNREVYDSLLNMINDAFRQSLDNYQYSDRANDYAKNEAMLYFEFLEEDGLVSYVFARGKHDYEKFCSNAIHTGAEADGLLIGSLVEELNKLFEKIKNIEPTVSVGKEEK